jgi:hypothetical protein
MMHFVPKDEMILDQGNLFAYNANAALTTGLTRLTDLALPRCIGATRRRCGQAAPSNACLAKGPVNYPEGLALTCLS